jgi:hypothetical protein
VQRLNNEIGALSVGKARGVQDRIKVLRIARVFQKMVLDEGDAFAVDAIKLCVG